MFSDKYLSCVGCDEPFVFSAGEQEFFAEKGLGNEPRRCASCRLVSRMHRNGINADILHDIICEECGVMTKVPFKPTGRKPVYCNGCLRQRACVAV